MHFGHFLFLMCCICCGTYAASLEKAKPQDVQENSFNDTATKQDLPDMNVTQIMPDIHDKGGTMDADIPGDYDIANITDSVSNGNESSVGSSGKITNDTSIKEEEPVGIPYTERSGGTRLGSSRYKSGRQQVFIGDLTLSDHVPRHGALMHKDDKIDTLNVRADTAMASNTGGNNAKRKRRIQSSSATPSIQIVILVVGAVVGCLLLTGFVRWRIRGKLNAQKKAKMSEEDCIYEGGRVYKGSSEMTTIYECEYEESQSMLRLGESLDVDMDDFQEGGTKFAEISCSQRFDMSLSGMSRAYQSRHNVYQPQARSPKSGRHFRLVPGSKRGSMNRHKYSHKHRYSKHLKRRLENMFVQTLETIPMENSAQVNEHGDNVSCSSYFSEHGNKHGMRNVSNENLATLLQQPNPIKHGSPTFRRGAFASILNTWRSLSFNRDWVGKMWQEQHNIRRLSDILRGRRESISSSKGSTKDSDAQSSRLSSSTESMSSSSSFASLFARRRSSNTDTDAALTAFFGKNVPLEKVYEENGRSFVRANTSDTMASKETEHDDNNIPGAGFDSDTPTPATDYREIPADDTFLSCRSYGDLHEEPVEYESLLSNSLQACNIPARQFSEHPRYQRIHQRKRSDCKRRSNSFNGSSTRSPVRLNHVGNTFRHDDFSQSLDNGSQVLVHTDLNSTAHLQPDHGDQHSVGSTSFVNSLTAQ